PSVVYCSISGFGTGNGDPERPGFDAAIQAESGLMHITGQTPSKVGVAITDVLTGLNAAVAILGALYRRAATGERVGERVEVSLLGSAMSGLVNVAQSALVSGEEAGRYGNAHPTVVPYQTFQASDGGFVVAAGNDVLYRALCTAIGRPDLAGDPRFITNPLRVANRDALIAELDAVFRTGTAAEWTGRLMAAGVPVGKIRGVLEALDAAPGVRMRVDHPTAGSIELLRTGFALAGLDQRAEPPPLLGEHTHTILVELGIDKVEISRLEAEGVIQQADTAMRPRPTGDATHQEVNHE
ncbi:MAG TPA: CoA transferase, partial [Thermopolyspora sp.]